jgi:hypothetical protein
MKIFQVIARICACYVALFFILNIINRAFRIYHNKEFIGVHTAGLVFIISLGVLLYCYSIHQLSRALDIKFMINRFSNGISRVISAGILITAIINMSDFTINWNSAAYYLLYVSIILVEKYWWNQ